MSGHDYIRDGDAIYRRSFAIIRAETDLSRFSEAEADIVVRMVHACGMPRDDAGGFYNPSFFFRCANVRSLSALSLMKPAASRWS